MNLIMKMMNLIDICLVWGLNCISVVANTKQKLLSLNTFEGGKVDVWTWSVVARDVNLMKLNC